MNNNHKSSLFGMDCADDNEEIVDDRLKQLYCQLRSSYLEFDFRLCLFACALYSLKSTTLLKPYPVQYFDVNNGEIDRDQLMNAFEDVPNLKQNLSELSQQTIDLIYWIVTHGNVSLSCISIDSIDNSDARTLLYENIAFSEYKHNQTLKPNYIFEIKYPDDHSKLVKFSNLKSLYGSFYAFHGTCIENVHSIIHNGLAMNLNKRSLFGIGTYLSSRLSVAIEFSPFRSNSYIKSTFGKKLSCVILCELINHPDVSLKKNRDQIPNTYYVISNNELIRVAYLLLYSTTHSRNVSKSSEDKRSVLVFIVIILFLILIGFFTTKSFII